MSVGISFPFGKKLNLKGRNMEADEFNDPNVRDGTYHFF
jgi:hypothetical protein